MTRTPEQVLPRILAALDDHRFEDLRELYSETVQGHTAAGHLSGVAEVVNAMRRIHEPLPALQHLLSGLVVDVDGEEAALRGNVISIFCDAAQRPEFEGASVWRGRLRRAADGWRVTEFSMALVWSRGTAPGI